MSRTRKQPYTKSKRFDKTCRNGGSCPYCAGNRQYSTDSRLAESVDQMDEVYDVEHHRIDHVETVDNSNLDEE